MSFRLCGEFAVVPHSVCTVRVSTNIECTVHVALSMYQPVDLNEQRDIEQRAPRTTATTHLAAMRNRCLKHTYSPPSPPRSIDSDLDVYVNIPSLRGTHIIITRPGCVKFLSTNPRSLPCLQRQRPPFHFSFDGGEGRRIVAGDGLT